MPLASCFGHPPVEPEVTFVSNNKKAPSGSAGGGFLGYPVLLVLVGELKIFLSPDLNIDIIPVCSLLKGRLLVELSGRALIPLPARSQPAAGTR